MDGWRTCITKGRGPRSCSASTRAGDDDLPLLRDIPDLGSLSLGERVTDGGLVYLSVLAELRSLSFYDSKVTGGGLAQLAGLEKLKHLSFVNAKITDEGLQQLGQLPALRGVQLIQAPITDAGLEHLKRLERLERIGIYCPNVSNQAIARLAEAMPGTKVSGERVDPA